MNGEIDDIIEGNIRENSDAILDSNLAKVSVSFPNFLNASFATGGGGTAEHIRKHYEQDEKVKELLNEFTIKDEAWKNFKQRKISILVEPMIAVTNSWNKPATTYGFTCAEAGLMELAGYVYRYENNIPKYSTKEEILEKVPFEKRILGYNLSTHERLYKALPYGSFKDRPEYITMIPNYTGTAGLNGADRDYMVDRLGCFEITAATISEIATPCTIKFHPNGKYFGIDSNIDEKYNIKDIKVGDEVKIPKTYSDNYFSPTITEEHTYNSYSLKINNKGEADGSTITIDSNFTIFLCHYNYNLMGKGEFRHLLYDCFITHNHSNKKVAPDQG